MMNKGMQGVVLGLITSSMTVAVIIIYSYFKLDKNLLAKDTV